MADEVVQDAEPVTEAPQDNQPADEPTVEALAIELGWKPKDQYNGDEANFRGAAEFIRAGQHGKLIKEVRQLKETQERLVRTSAKETQRLLDQQEAEWSEKLSQAVEDNNAKEAREASRQLDQIQRERHAPSPDAVSFVERNKWFGQHDEATAFAAALTDRLARQGKSDAEQLEEAEEAVKKRFPELFEDAPRRQAPQVASPSSRSSAPSRREKGAADLPKEVRAIGEQFVRMAQNKGHKGYTLDTYAKSYWAEQA